MYIWPNIFRSNGKQAIKLGQLIGYKMRKALKNHTQKVAKKLFPDPFSESIVCKFYAFCVYCIPNRWLLKYI